jgi:hypothetical protein
MQLAFSGVGREQWSLRCFVATEKREAEGFFSSAASHCGLARYGTVSCIIVWTRSLYMNKDLQGNEIMEIPTAIIIAESFSANLKCRAHPMGLGPMGGPGEGVVEVRYCPCTLPISLSTPRQPIQTSTLILISYLTLH